MSTLSAAMMIVARKLAIFEPRGEAGALDEGQVGAPAVLLPLGDDELLVGERADDGANLDPEFARGPEPAMPESDLVAVCAAASGAQGSERSVRAGE